MEYSGGGPEEILGWYSSGPGVLLGWSWVGGHPLSVDKDRASSAAPPREHQGIKRRIQGGFRQDSGMIHGVFRGVVLRKSSVGTRVVLGRSWGGPGLVVIF